MPTPQPEPKLTKASVNYIKGPVSRDPCRACTMFRTPISCTLVEGLISPLGHCDRFDAKP